MLSSVTSGTTIGLNGVLVQVEVDVYLRGFPQFRVVGLPSKAVEESKDRVKTALKNSGFKFPEGRIIVNLAPADIPKDGSVFDLPIAIGILAATGVFPQEALQNTLLFGELSLDGTLRPVIGGLPIAIAAKKKGVSTYIAPYGNAGEILLLENCTLYTPKKLIDVVEHLIGQTPLAIAKADNASSYTVSLPPQVNFAIIKGQVVAKRAVEIAATGAHNAHLVGPPGSGKTMIAKAMTGILPHLTREEILEVAQVYSVRRQEENFRDVLRRPFRNPHHTISIVGMIGGGGSRVLPGEISLAHRGVLFLDEFPEFPRSIIESLRQPLEDGVIVVTRSSGSVVFPASFILVCASNPCPCGYLGHPKKQCSCSASEIIKYQKKVSGPIMDRIDLHVHCQPVNTAEILDAVESEDSALILARVEMSRERQRRRFRDEKIQTNSQMSHKEIKKYIKLNSQSEEYLKNAIDRYSLSARGYFRILKVSRTIADIEGSDTIATNHLLEAIQYRVTESV